jgi:hypothetical protein
LEANKKVKKKKKGKGKKKGEPEGERKRELDKKMKRKEENPLSHQLCKGANRVRTSLTQTVIHSYVRKATVLSFHG